MDNNAAILSDDERGLLQEIMNIAFGKAAAELAEVISIFVILSVPEITLLKAAELPGYLREQVGSGENISIIEQNFWGEFQGNAFLTFPGGAGKELTSLLGSGPEPCFESEAVEVLERETLMEVGNILIGACVGKIAELLKDCVTYSPPRIVIDNNPSEVFAAELFQPACTAIVLKTVFCLNERNVNGFLFLVTSQESVAWLKTALDDFMSQYE